MKTDAPPVHVHTQGLTCLHGRWIVILELNLQYVFILDFTLHFIASLDRASYLVP